MLVQGLDCIDAHPLLDLKPERCQFTPLLRRSWATSRRSEFLSSFRMERSTRPGIETPGSMLRFAPE